MSWIRDGLIICKGGDYMLNVASIEEVCDFFEKQYRGSYTKVESVALEQGLNRFLGKDVYAPFPLPSFHRSVVDGYAVKMKDMIGVSEQLPAILRYVGDVEMGQATDVILKEGQAMYVPTGGMVPRGAEAMTMVEYSEKIDKDYVGLFKSSKPFEHMMLMGDELEKGVRVFKKGHCLRVQDIGLLSALNHAFIEVIKKPVIGIIPTGDEVIRPGSLAEFPRGKVGDINSFTIDGLVRGVGCVSKLYPVVLDSKEELEETIKKSLKECDIVLISGGSSAGFKDYTKEAIRAIQGGQIHFHGISMKPGKPTIIGEIQGTCVIGLPGQPVSAFLVTKVIVADLLHKMRGSTNKMLENNKKYRLAENVHSSPGRTTYQLVKKGLEDEVIPIRGKSGMISLLTEATGYFIIGKNQEGVNQSDEVTVYPL